MGYYTTQNTKRYSLDPPPGLRPSRGNELIFVQFSLKSRSTQVLSLMVISCTTIPQVHRRHCNCLLFLKKCGQIVIKQVADVLNGDVSRCISSHGGRVACIVALVWENRSQTVLPDLFHRCEDAQFVVHHNIVPCRVTPSYIG